MQAITQDRYGSAEVLELTDVSTPTPGPGQVLVRVQAASIHLGDLILAKGEPYILRAASGPRRPKQRIPGTDLAGIVQAVGEGTTSLRPGDHVFGWGSGAFAEYVVADADQFVTMPAELTFEEAAAVGVSATTALQLLRDDAKVRAGQQILITGASGGVGTYAVQIAKAFGAEVTGVAGPANLEMVRSLGADHVIDHTREDFTAAGRQYDVILDNVGGHSLGDLRRAIAPGGTLLLNGGGHTSGRWVGILAHTLKALAASIFVREVGRPIPKFPNRADLLLLKELLEAGSIRPVVAGTYPLSATQAAFARVEAGHAGGTLVITMPGSTSGFATVRPIATARSAA